MTLYKCSNCEKAITQEECVNYSNKCIECAINQRIVDLAHHLREAHVTFEEVIRKLIEQVDK